MIHQHPVRIYWEDTDAGGIVYHANYLKYAERARSEMLRAQGWSQSELAARGFAFVVRHLAVDFLQSARLDDLLEVETSVVEVGGASLQVGQVIRRPDGGPILARLTVKLAFIRLDGKPARLPAELRALS